MDMNDESRMTERRERERNSADDEIVRSSILVQNEGRTDDV
jgi:hypothetical protein